MCPATTNFFSSCVVPIGSFRPDYDYDHEYDYDFVRRILALMRTHYLAILLGLILVVTACADDPGTPEAQVRAVIESAREAAEEQSTRGVMRHVSERYRDDDGRDKTDLRNRLRLYLMQQESLSLAITIESVELRTAARAEARMEVELAGSAAERLRSMSGVGSRPLHLTASFDLEEDGEWRVIRAEWSRGRE